MLRTLIFTLTLAATTATADLPKGFEKIFNGRNLEGWHISQINSHGKTSTWRVEGGAITAGQDPAGVGGILLTDKEYGDFEVYLEVNIDYGCDSGLFLRSNEAGQAYQVMLDYLEGGNVGGIYGEGLKGVKGMRSEGWNEAWRKGEWNSVRARIEGAVPHITVWINDRKVTDFTDTENHAAGGAAKGMIAVQVHGGKRWTEGGKVRFRNLAVKELK